MPCNFGERILELDLAVLGGLDLGAGEGEAGLETVEQVVVMSGWRLSLRILISDSISISCFHDEAAVSPGGAGCSGGGVFYPKRQESPQRQPFM